LLYSLEQVVIGSTMVSLPVVRVVRLVRVFRLFKISRYVTWLKVRVQRLAAWPLLYRCPTRRNGVPCVCLGLQVFFQTIATSAVPLFMTFVAMIIVIVVMSALMYEFEKGSHDPSRGYAHRQQR
jgi:hypothetical protein